MHSLESLAAVALAASTLAGVAVSGLVQVGLLIVTVIGLPTAESMVAARVAEREAS